MKTTDVLFTRAIQAVFTILSNIDDGAFCKNSSRLLVVNYFGKILHASEFAYGVSSLMYIFCRYMSIIERKTCFR